MSTNGAPGAGGTTLSPPHIPPGRALRAVAFTPAVRGYPGGIADVATEQDDVTDDSAGGNGSLAGGPVAPVAEGAGRQGEAGLASGASVWQRSVAAWQEAGIDWLREPRPGPSPEDRAAAEADLQHTQPIPVVPASGPPGGAAGQPAEAVDEDLIVLGAAGTEAQPGAGAAGTARQHGAAAPGPTAENGTAATGAGADMAAADEDLIVLAGAEAATAGTAPAAGADQTAAGAGAAGTGPVTAGAAAAGPDSAATGATAKGPGSAAAGPAVGVSAAGGSVGGPAAGGSADGSTAGGPVAGGAPATVAGGAVAGAAVAPGETLGKRGRSRRVVVVAAAAAVVLVAGTIAGIAISRSGGPGQPTFGLLTPYPHAAPAAADYAAAGPGVPPTLTGIASAGKTVVAVGSLGDASLSLPVILDSQNGGRAWARATLGRGAVPPGPAAVPALIARGRGGWLTLGQGGSAWTSATGQAWQAAPALPMVAGDKILGLTRTRSGFLAVGANIPGPAGSVPSPVLWTSANGRTWLRKSGAALTIGGHGSLDAGGGSMVSLRWAAYRGNVIIVGGEVSRPVVEHRGRRRIIVNVVSPVLWRSRSNGATWQPVKVPTSHGAVPGVAGLAATGSAFVVIRPGHTLSGRKDAVAYISATGSSWRYGGRLIAGPRAPLHVLAVAASPQGFVVSGTTPVSRIAFVSAQGRGWHKTADQGGSSSTTVTGVTVAPGAIVVAAGFRHQAGSRSAGTSPYLLLTGTGPRRTTVGKAVLAAAGTPNVTVNSLADAGGEQVAAGTADGAPALWWAPAGGHWAPATVSAPANWHPGSLTSVVHGGSGWLAVGQAGPPVQPGSPSSAIGVVATSSDGRTWQAAPGAQSFAAPGTGLAQAAAGPAGYVVVGSAPGPGGKPAAAAWYSAGLTSWTRASVTGMAGQMLAVTAGRSGFVAVGSAGNTPAVWTARTGSAWQPKALPLPAGTASAMLTKVTATGERVVAVGNATRPAGAGHGAGPVPFAAVSSDGGRHWRETVLRSPAGPSTVTALTAAGHGFVAAGLSGAPGNQTMLSWSSPDGLSWQGGTPVAGPLPGRGVQQLTALSARDGALTGAGYAITQSGEQPVSWHARY